MGHEHHSHCEHANLAYCQRCDVAYCKGCNREWRLLRINIQNASAGQEMAK